MLVALATNPHQAIKCHRKEKNRGPTGIRTQGLSLTVRALCQLIYRATWLSFDISSCLIRFVPESARNNGGTTRRALFDACGPSREHTLSNQMSQMEENNVARPELEPRASRLPCEHCQQSCEPLGRPLTYT